MGYVTTAWMDFSFAAGCNVSKHFNVKLKTKNYMQKPSFPTCLRIIHKIILNSSWKRSPKKSFSAVSIAMLPVATICISKHQMFLCRNCDLFLFIILLVCRLELLHVDVMLGMKLSLREFYIWKTNLLVLTN